MTKIAFRQRCENLRRCFRCAYWPMTMAEEVIRLFLFFLLHFRVENIVRGEKNPAWWKKSRVVKKTAWWKWCTPEMNITANYEGRTKRFHQAVGYGWSTAVQLCASQSLVIPTIRSGQDGTYKSARMWDWSIINVPIFYRWLSQSYDAFLGCHLATKCF